MQHPSAAIEKLFCVWWILFFLNWPCLLYVSVVYFIFLAIHFCCFLQRCLWLERKKTGSSSQIIPVNNLGSISTQLKGADSLKSQCLNRRPSYLDDCMSVLAVDLPSSAWIFWSVNGGCGNWIVRSKEINTWKAHQVPHTLRAQCVSGIVTCSPRPYYSPVSLHKPGFIRCALWLFRAQYAFIFMGLCFH